MSDLQRNQVMFERLLVNANKAQTKFSVTVVIDTIEVTVTIEEKKNLANPLELNIIKQLISEYMSTTDSSDFDSVINNIYFIIALRYPGRDIEIMIYDTVECLTVMKIFNQPAV